MSENDRLDRIKTKAKNNPVLVIIIALGITMIYLGNFTDSLDKVLTFIEKYFPEQPIDIKKKEVLVVEGESKKLSEPSHLTKCIKANKASCKQLLQHVAKANAHCHEQPGSKTGHELNQYLNDCNFSHDLVYSTVALAQNVIQHCGIYEDRNPKCINAKVNLGLATEPYLNRLDLFMSPVLQ